MVDVVLLCLGEVGRRSGHGRGIGRLLDVGELEMVGRGVRGGCLVVVVGLGFAAGAEICCSGLLLLGFGEVRRCGVGISIGLLALLVWVKVRRSRRIMGIRLLVGRAGVAYVYP